MIRADIENALGHHVQKLWKLATRPNALDAGKLERIAINLQEAYSTLLDSSKPSHFAQLRAAEYINYAHNNLIAPAWGDLEDQGTAAIAVADFQTFYQHYAEANRQRAEALRDTRSWQQTPCPLDCECRTED